LSLRFASFAKNLCALAFFYRKGAKDHRKGRKNIPLGIKYW